MRRIIFPCALAGVLAVPVFGQGIDPLIGTWKLNLEKSTCIACQLPKSETMTFVRDGQNFINTVEGVDAQGQPFKRMVPIIYDGMRHPITGNPEWDAAAFTRIGNTVSFIRFKNGNPVAVTQGVLVPGKTYTVTEEAIDLNGQLYHDVMVLERQ